jgi:uncharacterized protein YqgV (UPF0045/DUF77 family)
MSFTSDPTMARTAPLEVGVELSLYPLDRDYIPPIKALLDRLNSNSPFKITTNSMSTQIFGRYDELMPFLLHELRPLFDGEGKAVVVMKILGPLADA